jgi:uncharacterized protein YcfJ
MRAVLGLLLAGVMLPAQAAPPAHAYDDYARVIAVRPLYAPAAGDLASCERASGVRSGDVREHDTNVTLGAALREDLRASLPPECVAPPARAERRLRGYEVTYSYGGRTYVRRMAHYPGSEVRVRVEVSGI